MERKGFVQWLAQESPDILCIQETKANPSQLSSELLNTKDKDGNPYFAYWASAQKAGYSGTAIYSKTEPLSVSTMGIEEFDAEGRVLQADFADFSLISAYFPNAQETLARLGYKLAFCEAMFEHCGKLVASGRHLVLCGDYNIAHKPIDLARPDENEGNSGYLPEERAWMDKFTASGYVDTFRCLHPNEGSHYTWWTYRKMARSRNVGWRIDYHCVDEGFFPRVQNALIRSEITGSDHCPVELDI